MAALRDISFLTPAAARGYADSVTGVPVIGICSPEALGGQPPFPCESRHFLRPWFGFAPMGGPNGEPKGSPVPSGRSANPFGSPTFVLQRGRAVTRPFTRSLTMDTHTPGASAPVQALSPAIFQFHSTTVRTVDRDGQVWFVAGDVAKALGYADAIHLTRVLDEDEAALHNVEIRSENGTLQTREVTIISESGLYHALLKSRKREAKPFRKWVTAEVLPAIRRSGRYAVPQDHTPSLVPPGTKLLLTFEADGRCRAEPVPEGAMVVTARQLAEIVEANGYILAKPIDQEFKL